MVRTELGGLLLRIFITTPPSRHRRRGGCSAPFGITWQIRGHQFSPSPTAESRQGASSHVHERPESLRSTGICGGLDRPTPPKPIFIHPEMHTRNLNTQVAGTHMPLVVYYCSTSYKAVRVGRGG